MSYPKTEAPYTERGYFDSSGVVFNVEDLGTSVKLSWSNTPFTGGSPAHMVTVGKEYGTVANPIHTKAEVAALGDVCNVNSLSCIPHPAGLPAGYPLDSCFSGIYDTPIAFINYQAGGVTEIIVPYNQFQLAGKTCAFQTDGQEAQYYVELAQIVGASAVKTKWVFNYTTPTAPFTACGVGQVPVPPPPPVTEHPGKGKKN